MKNIGGAAKAPVCVDFPCPTALAVIMRTVTFLNVYSVVCVDDITSFNLIED